MKNKKSKYLEEINYHKNISLDLKDKLDDLENNNKILAAENENILYK